MIKTVRLKGVRFIRNKTKNRIRYKNYLFQDYYHIYIYSKKYKYFSYVFFLFPLRICVALIRYILYTIPTIGCWNLRTVHLSFVWRKLTTRWQDTGVSSRGNYTSLLNYDSFLSILQKRGETFMEHKLHLSNYSKIIERTLSEY